MNYIVTEREVLITRYRVSGEETKEDAIDAIQSGDDNYEVLDKDIESMSEGEDAWIVEDDVSD